RLCHVRGDLAEHTLLRCGRPERQDALDGLARLLVQCERDAGLRAGFAPLEFEAELQEKQLFENQPAVRWALRIEQLLQAFAWLRPVCLPERRAPRHQL